MPLADFIADLGRNTAVGQVAQAFGGRNIDQRAHDMFVNEELPKFAESISQAQTRAEIEKAGAALIGTAMKRGVPQAGIKNLMDMLVGPALQNLQKGEVDSILKDYGPRSAEPRPEGVEGPLTPSGNFIDPTTGKPIDEAGAIRLNRAFGGNAQTMDNLLRAPWQNQQARATTGKTDAETAALIAKQSRLASIPTEPRESGVSLQQLAEFPSLSQVEPQREKAEDPLLEQRRGLIGAQTELARAQAKRAQALADRARQVASTPQGSALYKEFVGLGGDPNDEEGYLDFVERRSKVSRRPTPAETLFGGAGGQPQPQGGSKNPNDRRRRLKDILSGAE